MRGFAAMLDTNVVSELMRAPQGPLRQRLERFGVQNACISILSAAELRYGAYKVASRRIHGQIGSVLASIQVVPFETPADDHYGRLRADLFRIGRPIGPTDLLIAAHALSLKLTLVTGNTGEFSRVPGLVVENWLD